MPTCLLTEGKERDLDRSSQRKKNQQIIAFTLHRQKRQRGNQNIPVQSQTPWIESIKTSSSLTKRYKVFYALSIFCGSFGLFYSYYIQGLHYNALDNQERFKVEVHSVQSKFKALILEKNWHNGLTQRMLGLCFATGTLHTHAPHCMVCMATKSHKKCFLCSLPGPRSWEFQALGPRVP